MSSSQACLVRERPSIIATPQVLTQVTQKIEANYIAVLLEHFCDQSTAKPQHTEPFGTYSGGCQVK